VQTSENLGPVFNKTTDLWAWQAKNLPANFSSAELKEPSLEKVDPDLCEQSTQQDSKTYGLVCSTVFQGLTLSSGDIYSTKEEAQAEYRDMQKMRVEAEMDEDEDFSVIEIVRQPDGSWVDTFGEKITLTDGDFDEPEEIQKFTGGRG
jgi:hypothetical protein